MVVLTVTTTANPCTVYFDKPLPKASFVRLISCSLPNSWHNLKERGTMSLTAKDGNTSSVKNLLEGHYTLEAKLPTEISLPQGAMIIYNLENRRIRLDQDVTDFLGIDRTLKFITFIKRFNTPSTYFLYCDLVDPTRILQNGKKSNLIVTFDVRGKAFEKVHYQTPADWRDDLTGECVNSVTLSVKDDNSELFDFLGQKLTFELAIN